MGDRVETIHEVREDWESEDDEEEEGEDEIEPDCSSILLSKEGKVRLRKS